jgi:hypothetical protein
VFKPAATIEEIRKDNDPDALRQRPDFRELFPLSQPKGAP